MTAMRPMGWLILIPLLVGLGSSPADAGEEIPGPEKTLTRLEDPVIIEGKAFGPLLGEPLDHLSLWVFKSGHWSPVPFQVDEKKPDGEYAFTCGPQASRDPDPGLDADDELVFMVADTGDEAGRAVWPEGAVKGVEIEITGPKNGTKAWTYLFCFSGEAPKSKTDYVKYHLDFSAKRWRVSSPQYAMEGDLNRIAPDFLATVRPDGSVGPDILDRLKIRGEFVLPLNIRIDYLFDKWVRTDTKAYIDGPVRVLVYGSGYLDVASFIKLRGQGYSVIFYYPNHVIWPMYVEVPFDLRGVVKEWPTLGFMDFNKNIYGTHAFSAANPYSEEVVFDGKMSEPEKHLDTSTEINWVAGFGPQGGMVARLPKPPEWKDVKILPYYLDDETVVDEPEDDPGVSGVGFKLVGMEKLGKYSTTFYQYYYFKRNLAPEGVHTILDIMDHPLKVKTKVMEEP